MRRYVLAAALVAALAPAPASAENTCLVRVSEPAKRGWVTEVEATMTCTAWFPGLELTVCLESVKPLGDAVGWGAEVCETVQTWAGSTSVWGTVGWCVRNSPAVVRGAAYAVDEYGRPVEGFGRPALDVTITCEI